MTERIAIIVVLETDDRDLQPENIDVSTVKAVAALRRAVIRNLPKLSRVVAVMSEDHAKMMCQTHSEIMAGIRSDCFPPVDYVPPTRD